MFDCTRGVIFLGPGDSFRCEGEFGLGVNGCWVDCMHKGIFLGPGDSFRCEGEFGSVLNEWRVLWLFCAWIEGRYQVTSHSQNEFGERSRVGGKLGWDSNTNRVWRQWIGLGKPGRPISSQ